MPGVATKNTDGLMGKLHAARVNGDLPAQLPVYTVAEANALTGLSDWMVIGVSNGNSGGACVAVRIGGVWLRLVPGAAISAT